MPEIKKKKGKLFLAILMAVVASESCHPGRRNADFGSPESDLFLVMVSLGAQGLWSQQVWGGRACVCETSQLYVE